MERDCQRKTNRRIRRCGLKRMEIQIPAAARGSEPPRLSLTNQSAALPDSEEFIRFYQSCELLNRLDASGILDRQSDGLALDGTRCPGFDGFCQFAGVNDVTAAEAATAKAASAALIRVGAYQLLRTPAMPPHAAMVEGDDFSVDSWEARTRLEVVAAMIVEPWLFSQAESAMRPVYDAQKPNPPSTQIVGAWLGIV